MQPLTAKSEKLKETFERCWPFLQESLDVGGMTLPDGTYLPPFRREHLWERLSAGKCLFWPGEDSAFITEFYCTPTGLRSHHCWVTGGNLEEIKQMMPAIEDYGRQRECHRQTSNGRRGWLKGYGPGWYELGVRKAKDLL